MPHYNDIKCDCTKGYPKGWGVRKIVGVCSNDPDHAPDAWLVTKKGKILCPDIRGRGYQAEGTGWYLEIDDKGVISMIKKERRYALR